MGKYMRKGKVSGAVAVMEVPGGALLGVRTRSRALALEGARRPPEKGEYLELRSRRIEKPHKEAPAPAVPMKGDGAAAPAEGEGEVSFGENGLGFDAVERSTRETTPYSLIRSSETISTPGSTNKSKTSNSTASHRTVEASGCRFIPRSLEMEEFFAAAERQLQHKFREKYNFCPVNDCPLPGRYEWTALD
ncbi:hypothetical protein ACP4OV_002477 [Aristida adscensionis]